MLYNFVVYNEYMAHLVNNIAVGHNPGDIERKNSYDLFFESIGDSSDNIKIIPNFLSEEEIQYFLDNMDENQKVSFESQKDEDNNAINWMHIYTNIEDKFGVIRRIAWELVKAYNFTGFKPKDNRISVAEWETGTKLNLHVDDLGYVTDNHLPTLIYLNDDYEGGEISFVTHDVCVKPNRGDLIIFPGNLNYAHEVKEVLSGTRYTLPIWFTIV